MTKILLSDFLTSEISIKGSTSLKDFQNMFEAVFNVHPMEDGTIQVSDRNIVAFFDKTGLYRFEILVIDGPYSDAIDMQGLRLEEEREIIVWLHEKDICFKELVLESDETGVTYQITFPSKADAIIISGKVRRIAKSY
ncbi:hypothetical protein E7T06_07590 [Deinococcus sp. Arct2-2]|uniref:hypothetical protein n=1 Tax=Deinococcus sp. Arct2-2 TaxID=2568653 RepID=UPI0010A31C50|nr:hypothetical protein [Deinococcus sp. Arct2-2]THF70326.1 hypothetical protein E7T06_07590 [Deinococcus sp. Arct2-2]